MAKLFDVIVLDQTVSGPAVVYSDVSFSNVLSRAEKLVISAVATEISGGTPSVTIGVEGSPDHLLWAPIDGGTPPMQDQPLAATPANLATCVFTSDQLAFTRLKVTVGGTAKARLTVHVTGRST